MVEHIHQINNYEPTQNRNGVVGGVETQANPQPRHGRITIPQSRADIYLADWRANGLESGKFFPARVSGLTDPVVPSDVPNVTPPEDGRIASAGQSNAFILDEVSDWYKHPVRSGQTVEFRWVYTAPHGTRRHNYFITRVGWHSNQVLTREQFDSNPIAVFENPCQPFWSCPAPTEGPTHHFTLPVRTGYHVILAVWEISDTGNAFYQVIDFNFTN